MHHHGTAQTQRKGPPPPAWRPDAGLPFTNARRRTPTWGTKRAATIGVPTSTACRLQVTSRVEARSVRASARGSRGRRQQSQAIYRGLFGSARTVWIMRNPVLRLAGPWRSENCCGQGKGGSDADRGCLRRDAACGRRSATQRRVATGGSGRYRTHRWCPQDTGARRAGSVAVMGYRHGPCAPHTRSQPNAIPAQWLDERWQRQSPN
jgi:hypothetical protein